MPLKTSSDVQDLLTERGFIRTGCMMQGGLVTCERPARIHTLRDSDCWFCAEDTEHIVTFEGVGGDNLYTCTQCGRGDLEQYVPRHPHEWLTAKQIGRLRQSAVSQEAYAALMDHAYGFMADCDAPAPCQHCTDEYERLAALLPATADSVSADTPGSEAP